MNDERVIQFSHQYLKMAINFAYVLSWSYKTISSPLMYSLESEKLSIFSIYLSGKISVLLPIVIITSDTGIRIDLRET